MPMPNESAKALREQRAPLAKSIQKLAERANDEWTDDDEREWLRVNGEYDSLTTRIAVVERGHELRDRSPKGDRRDDPGREDIHGHDEFGFPRNTRDAIREADRPVFRDANGREVRGVLPGESFRRTLGDMDSGENLSLGRGILGLQTGRWDGAEREQRAMQESIGASGGFLLTPELSGTVIDLARNRATVLEAGAVTVPMDGPELKLARVSGDPTANWRGEGAAITQSEMTLQQISLKAKSLAVLVPVTLELWEDAENIASAIENAISTAIGLELDRAALRGLGAGNEPLGLRYATSVNEIDLSASAPDYDDVVDAVEDVDSANGMANAWIKSPRDRAFFAKLKDSQSRYLDPPKILDPLAKFSTNQIPTNLGGGTNESEMYVGDFGQMLIGMRRQIRVETFREGSTTTDNALTELKVWIRAYLRADVQLMHPDHFTRIIGVTN